MSRLVYLTRGKVFILLFCLPLVGWGTELQAYLKLRRQHGVKGVCAVEALAHIVGKRVVEIKATVRGVASCEGNHSLLLALSDSHAVVASTERLEDWWTTGQVPIRALVQVERSHELEAATYRLIAVVPEAEMVRWEVEEKARHLRQQARGLAYRLPAPSGRRPNLSSRAKPPSHLNGRYALDPETYRRYYEYYYQELLRYQPKLTPERADQLTRAILRNLSYYPAYYHWIAARNPRLSPQQVALITQSILVFSGYYELDPRLIVAIMLVESGFNPKATSHKGAMGLGQLMPGTARGLGVANPYDPVQNLAGSIRLVRGHLERYARQLGRVDGWEHVVLALAAYNAGSGAVRRYGGVPPYRETRAYVKKVLQLYRQLRGE